MIKVTLFPTTLSMNKGEVTFFIKVYIVFALIFFTYLPENQIWKICLLIQTNSFIIFTSPNPVLLVQIFGQVGQRDDCIYIDATRDGQFFKLSKYDWVVNYLHQYMNDWGYFLSYGYINGLYLQVYTELLYYQDKFFYKYLII